MINLSFLVFIENKITIKSIGFCKSSYDKNAYNWFLCKYIIIL